jgi:rhodanese-related sulfurtransferase
MTRLAIVAASLVVLAGCTADSSDLQTLSVSEVAALRAKGAAVAVDANGTSTREKYGVIPGALLLSSQAEAAIDEELPADKTTSLVFYCASPRCSAAPSAARKAAQAGYRDVRVMPDGIKGWVEAGLPVERPPST